MAAVQLHCVEQQERSSIVHQKSLVLSDVGTAESYSRNPPAAQNFCRIFVLCFSWVSPSSEDHHKVSHCSCGTEEWMIVLMMMNAGFLEARFKLCPRDQSKTRLSFSVGFLPDFHPGNLEV